MGADPSRTDDREYDVALVQGFVDALPEIDAGRDIVDVAEHRVLSVVVRQPVKNAAGDDSRISPSIGNRDPRAVLRNCFRNQFAGAFEVAVADIGDPGAYLVRLTTRQKLSKLTARHRLAPIRNQADDSGGGVHQEREIGRQIKIRRRVVVKEQRMCQLKYGLPHHHIEKPDREQRAENRRQLEIQGTSAAPDVEFGFHVKEHDRMIHANRDNKAEEHRVFLPPPLYASVKAASKKKMANAGKATMYR